MTKELQLKIRRAIRLLQSIEADEIELCYSGGKDSDVILELAKMAGIKYRPIYKNTTIDPPGTIAHVKSKGVEIHQPKERFFYIIQKKGFPTRRARFCCTDMKEYKILDFAIQGIRRCESKKRKEIYSANEPIKCRIYGSKKNHVNVILPILSWSDNDIKEFISERNIKCHPLYYDNQGKFHVERRLGCLGCPLQADRGLSDFIQYPNLVKAWIKYGQKWLDTHPNAASHKKFETIYDLFYHNVFCKSYSDYSLLKSVDLWGKTPNFKLFLESFFNIKL
ncbi:MAG: phosphoadenosine phosphosulfate reductase family protein [Prevotella sp.]|nr:phosphoadenosine phosphosulfate reductase family protein [Prevotella sp.]